MKIPGWLCRAGLFVQKILVFTKHGDETRISRRDRMHVVVVLRTEVHLANCDASVRKVSFPLAGIHLVEPDLASAII